MEEWVDREEPVALDLGSFQPAGARGNTIRPTAGAHLMVIAGPLIDLEELLAEIHWRIVRQARDSRSAGRAETCLVLAAAERV